MRPRLILDRHGGAEEIEIRRLDADAHAHLDGLAAVLADCVAGGASVSYMAPFSHEEARAAFEAVAADVQAGRRLLLAAFTEGTVVGTVQVVLALPPNQPHRGEIAKLLVHRSARRRGIARLLMERAEAEARAEGKTLLVLDRVTGDDAERLLLAPRLDEGRRSYLPTPSIRTGGPATRPFSGRRFRTRFTMSLVPPGPRWTARCGVLRRPDMPAYRGSLRPCLTPIFHRTPFDEAHHETSS